jgi:hypothetical protein
VINPHRSTPAELQDDMEAARLRFEQWRADRGGSRFRTLAEEYPDKYAGLKADEIRERGE